LVPERTHEQIIQDQVAEKAKQAAAVAAATGTVAKDAFLGVLTGAKTFGDKAVVFGALAGFVAFFLPWITLFGAVSASGLRLALDASWVFWLYPLSMIVCFLMSGFLRSAVPKRRILAARWFIVIGTLWFGPGVAAVCNVFSGAVGFGGYLVTAAAGAILFGGILQINERLAELTRTA
jgi:predicted phage tail protein